MVEYKSISRIGSRTINEDCVGMHQKGEEYGFFLADGLGGHGKGDLASQEAVKQAILEFEDGGSTEETMQRIFEQAQEKVLELQRQEQNCYGIKTTLTALLIGKKDVQCGHIGDSRVYWFWHKKLMGRTLDHSVPQMLVNIGEIEEEEIRSHPDRNRLLRVMGSEWDTPQYQYSEKIPLKKGQAFLLCSDGFWELITEKMMVRFLRRADSVDEWLDTMMEYVEEKGREKNMDNYSAIAVWITGR